MRNNLTIQKLISFFLLLVFVTSIAPKTYFHDAVAHHKDVAAVCKHPITNTPCLHQSSINCHFDLLVVTSLYAFKAEPSLNHFRPSFSPVVCAVVVNYSCYTYNSKESRGPPSRS